MGPQIKDLCLNVLLGHSCTDEGFIPETRLQQVLGNLVEYFPNGLNCRITKMYNSRKTKIIFATETSFPATYMVNDQTFYSISEEIALNSSSPISFGKTIETPEWVDIKINPNITYASNTEIQLNIVNINGDQQFCVGNDNYFQIALPLQSNLIILSNQSKIIFNMDIMEPKISAPLVLHTKKPYISTGHVNSVCSTIRGIDLQSMVRVNTTYRKYYGFDFNIQYEGDFVNTEKLYKILEVAKLQDVIKMLSSEFAHIAHVSIFYPDKSPSKKIQFVYRKTKDIQDNCNIDGTHKKTIACETISYTTAINLENVEYTAGLLIMTSDLAQIQGFRFYFNRTSKTNSTEQFGIGGFVLSHRPTTNELNINHSLQIEPKVNLSMQFELSIGESSWRISPKTFLSRSKERLHFIKDHPKMEECLKQMSEGNFQLATCNRLMDLINILNIIDFHLAFKLGQLQVAKKVCNFLPTCSTFLQIDESELLSENDTDSKHLNIVFTFSKDLENLELTIKSKGKLIARFNNIPVNEWISGIFLVHPVHTLKTRVFAKLMEMDTFRPVCAVDFSAVSTFDRKTYLAELNNKWTLAMHYLPISSRIDDTKLNTRQRQDEQLDQISVLVRRSQIHINSKEIMLSIRTPKTDSKLLNIHCKLSDMKPNVFELYVNGSKYDDIYYNQSVYLYHHQLEIYMIPNNELKILVRDTLVLFFDGIRVKITLLDNKFRGTIQGLCGNFNGETFDEFLIPEGCILESDINFPSYYTITQNKSLFTETTHKRCTPFIK